MRTIKTTQNHLMLFGCAVTAIMGSMLGGCVHKLPPPAPVMGVDIVELSNGQTAPFNGTLFSPYYLNEYLEWKLNNV